jgi:hypothetical protein
VGGVGLSDSACSNLRLWHQQAVRGSEPGCCMCQLRRAQSCGNAAATHMNACMYPSTPSVHTWLRNATGSEQVWHCAGL